MLCVIILCMHMCCMFTVHICKYVLFILINRHMYYLSKVLKDLRPRYVILYDPNVSCVRQLEVYKCVNPGVPMRVYGYIHDIGTIHGIGTIWYIFCYSAMLFPYSYIW